MSGPIVTLREARSRTPACLELLRQLVETESPTGHRSGNLAAARILEGELVRAAAAVERVSAAGWGDHLTGRLGGTETGTAQSGASGCRGGPDSASAAAALEAHSPGRRPIRRHRRDGPLLVLGHMDTVHPIGTLARLPFRVDGARVWGPGAYDMKAGLAVALTALRLLAARSIRPSGGLTFLITCDEERGSPHSRSLIEAEARASRAALVVEPSVPGGAVKLRRKGVAAYVLKVRGISAHSGIEPQRGASAVHEIARQVGRIRSLERDEEGTTINVGVLEGGTAENVVAEHAHCTVDARFRIRREARRVDEAMRALRPFDERCTLSLAGGVNRWPLEATPESIAMQRRARALAAGLGFDVEEGESGGASDGNIAAAAGCPTLDGLGPDGDGAHTLEEHVLLADLPRRIALMAGLFMAL